MECPPDKLCSQRENILDSECVLFRRVGRSYRWFLAFVGATLAVVVPAIISGVADPFWEETLGAKRGPYWGGVLAGGLIWLVSIVITANTKHAGAWGTFLGAVGLPSMIFGGVVVGFKFFD